MVSECLCVCLTVCFRCRYQGGQSPQNTLHCSDIQRVEMPPREPKRVNLVTIGRVKDSFAQMHVNLTNE